MITRCLLGTIQPPPASWIVLAAALVSPLAGCRARPPSGPSAGIEVPARFDERRLIGAIERLEHPELTRLASVPLRFRDSSGRSMEHQIHPQGMVVLPELQRIFISAVEITRPRDPTRSDPGAGNGYLFVFDLQGRPVTAVKLNADQVDFHPGGIDHHAGTLYLPLAAYRPASTATVVAVPLSTLTPRALFRAQDHLGFVVVDRATGNLLGGSWGSADWYLYSRDGQLLRKLGNPTPGRLEHQDGQSLPGGLAVLTGIRTRDEPRQFGFDLVRFAGDTVEPVRSVRWPDTARHRTRQGHSPFHNPTFLWVGPGQATILALTAADDQHRGRSSTLRLYQISTPTRGP